MRIARRSSTVIAASIGASLFASTLLPDGSAGAATPGPRAPWQNLPTPLEHYEQYDPITAARDLLPRVAVQLEPATLQRILAAAGPDPTAAASRITADEALQLLAGIDLELWRPELIELLLHASRVLDLIPEENANWLPLVHDSLLVVLNGMDADRLRARIAGQAALPADAARGDRMLAFAAETPTFQKVGQIMARSTWLPDDLKAPFQSLENDIATTGRNELVALIEQGLGNDTIREYRLALEDDVLSEASVGAVIGGTMVPPGESEQQRVVVKVIKQYAVTAIEQDLDSISTLLSLLEDNRDFYDIGDTPLVDMFREVRASLAREIQAADERANLRAARSYFADDPRVVVPAVCECSSANITVMERIEGVKVTDAYPDEPNKRRGLAQRLADVTMYDVMFADDDALFHGDPHAGNVFFVGDAEDPYRIALLDWGLQGTLELAQRVKLVQVGLGLQLKHADRLRDNVDGLLTGSIDRDADSDTVDGVIEALFEAADRMKEEAGEDPGTLDLLDRLVSELAKAGYSVDNDILLYVKAMYTIDAVMSDIDPEFDSGEYVGGQVKRQILREMPKRLGNTVWIPGMWSHDYDSMTSNNDVWAGAINSMGLAFKAVGAGIWRGLSFPFR